MLLILNFSSALSQVKEKGKESLFVGVFFMRFHSCNRSKNFPSCFSGVSCLKHHFMSAFRHHESNTIGINHKYVQCRSVSRLDVINETARISCIALRLCLLLFKKEEKTIFFIEHDSVTMKWKDTFIVYDWWMSEDGRLYFLYRDMFLPLFFPCSLARDLTGFSLFPLGRLNKKWCENCFSFSTIRCELFFLLLFHFKSSSFLVNEDIMWENQVKFRVRFNPKKFDVAKFIYGTLNLKC